MLDSNEIKNISLSILREAQKLKIEDDIDYKMAANVIKAAALYTIEQELRRIEDLMIELKHI